MGSRGHRPPGVESPQRHATGESINDPRRRIRDDLVGGRGGDWRSRLWHAQGGGDTVASSEHMWPTVRAEKISRTAHRRKNWGPSPNSIQPWGGCGEATVSASDRSLARLGHSNFWACKGMVRTAAARGRHEAIIRPHALSNSSHILT